jgi:hypothetical protein
MSDPLRRREGVVDAGRRRDDAKEWRRVFGVASTPTAAAGSNQRRRRLRRSFLSNSAEEP